MNDDTDRPSGDPATLHEIVEQARRRLSDGVWNYLAGGAESETTMRRNRQALDAIAFRPRVLRDVFGVDCSTTLLGRTLPRPGAARPHRLVAGPAPRPAAQRSPRPRPARASR